MALRLQLLFLVAIANAMPLFGHAVLRSRGARPIDGGRGFLGPSKTWRGLVLSLLGTTATATALGFAWWVGPVVAATAMAGDLASSALKRRLGLPAGAMALGIDQVPESALPLLAVHRTFGLDVLDLAGMVATFLVAELLVSRVLFLLALRERPY